jgi:N-acetylneuraminate lyase
MTAPSFSGIYPALLTPLDSSQKLRRDVAQGLLQHLLAAGVSGAYIAGSTGEGMRLTMATRKALVEALMPVLPAEKQLIVHVGTPEVADAIRLAEHAALHGAHAVSSLPPTGDSRQVHSFYEQLAKHSPLPLILYYFPKVIPTAFGDPQELIDVCDLPNVLGVKFTDFNFYLLQQLVKRGKLVFNGYDEALAAGLLMGAQGGIGSTYNMMPQVYLEIFRAAQRGEWENARLWQSRANDVLTVLLRYPFFPALRAVMKERGFDCGPMMSGETFASASQSRQLLDELDRDMPDEIGTLIGWKPAVSAK